jgi:hypothetical protein
VINVEVAVTYTRLLCAISLCIGTAEYLAIGSQFTGPGIFSDRIYPLNWIRGPRLLVGLYHAICSYRVTMIVHLVQLGLALLLFVPLQMRSYSLILLLLFFVQIHTFTQTGVGHDGSDHMLLVLMPALAVAYAFRLKGPAAWIALWFIVAQATLAYATSGISKLISPVWRSGRALQLIFNTACYGSDLVSRWLKRAPALAFVGSWTVIVFECTMPLTLVAPKNILITMLIVAGLFHFGCALTMGLNCFLWSFAATFPLLYFCNVNRTSALSGLEGTHGEKLAMLAGGAIALIVVASVLIRYYELFPRLRAIGRSPVPNDMATP